MEREAVRSIALRLRRKLLWISVEIILRLIRCTKSGVFMKRFLLLLLAIILQTAPIHSAPYFSCDRGNTIYTNHGPNQFIIRFRNKSNDWYFCSVKCEWTRQGTGDVFRVMDCSGVVVPQHSNANDEKSVFCAQSAASIGEDRGNNSGSSIFQNCSQVATPAKR